MKKIIILLFVFSVCYSYNEDNADVMNNQLNEEGTSLPPIDSSKEIDDNQSKSKQVNCDLVTEVVVANLDDISIKENEIIAHMMKNSLLKGVNNIRDVAYYLNKTDGNEYIEAVGDNKEGGLTSVRAKVQTKKISAENYLLRISMTIDTCSGVNCSKCTFNDDGECDCDKIGNTNGEASYCNHSTSC